MFGASSCSLTNHHHREFTLTTQGSLTCSPHNVLSAIPVLLLFRFSCHVRNFTFSAFCYTPREHEKTVNTFITGKRPMTLNACPSPATFVVSIGFWCKFFVGFYGKQWNFIISRVPQDNLQPYKCCKTPAGYYLDYTACYYLPTHDPYWVSLYSWGVVRSPERVNAVDDSTDR